MKSYLFCILFILAGSITHAQSAKDRKYYRILQQCYSVGGQLLRKIINEASEENRISSQDLKWLVRAGDPDFDKIDHAALVSKNRGYSCSHQGSDGVMRVAVANFLLDSNDIPAALAEVIKDNDEVLLNRAGADVLNARQLREERY